MLTLLFNRGGGPAPDPTFGWADVGLIMQIGYADIGMIGAVGYYDAGLIYPMGGPDNIGGIV